MSPFSMCTEPPGAYSIGFGMGGFFRHCLQILSFVAKSSLSCWVLALKTSEYWAEPLGCFLPQFVGPCGRLDLKLPPPLPDLLAN